MPSGYTIFCGFQAVRRNMRSRGAQSAPLRPRACPHPEDMAVSMRVGRAAAARAAPAPRRARAVAQKQGMWCVEAYEDM